MSKPRIGISTYGRDDGNKFHLPAEYVDSVRRAGGLPYLLPPGETTLEEWLSNLDGVILAGGGDVDPKHYQGDMHEKIIRLDAERDDTELELARLLLNKNIPTFAICRGLQIINVLLGGTLHEHIPDAYGEKVLHRLPPHNQTEHILEIKKGSMLAELLGAHHFSAVSWHHQAIKDLASGFVSVATAPDGVIEAVESNHYPNLISVQWHPELTANSDPIQQKLFDQFILLTKKPH